MSKFCLPVLLLLSLLFTTDFYGDGNDILGVPSIDIAEGNTVYAGGVGLEDGQPGDIVIDIPADTTIKQVLLYYAGRGDYGADPMDVTIDGQNVDSVLVGEVYNPLSGNLDAAVFRSDITSLSLVEAGKTNILTVQGLSFGPVFYRDSGAGVLVIAEEEGSASVEVRDGADYAYSPLEPLSTTVPQTFTFPASTDTRLAELIIFAADVGHTSTGEARPNSIRVNVDGDEYTLTNPLFSSDGNSWDSLVLTVEIPAGADELTVELISGPGNNPTSLIWVTANLILPDELCIASLGDFIWHDLNKDGVQNADEPGIEGVTVLLYDGAENMLTQAVTDESGFYGFTNLCAGAYKVKIPESQFEAGAPLFGATQTYDYDGLNTPNCAEEELEDAEVNLMLDFGYAFEAKGCTPGFWKNHPYAWEAPYITETPLADVFVIPFDSLKNDTLMEALNYGGGPGDVGATKILLRATVAALLNEAKMGGSYYGTPSIQTLADSVNAALASGRKDILELASILDYWNNAGCELSEGGKNTQPEPSVNKLKRKSRKIRGKSKGKKKKK